jgi:asparagine synthase (glutamine-hydrolysing)
MLISTREEIAVDGQRQDSDRIEVLHWDGRLDNRSDLLLRLRDSLAADNSNAAIVRATYKRWGVDGLVHLIGDWSLVIRDHVKRTTVLASDFAGVRPLYYHVHSGQVLWSSRLETLVQVTEISDLDEQYIAGFLMFGGYPNRTPYQGIYSVPPGHAVCVSADGTSTHRFWSMPTGDVIQYRNERRYDEQLRSLFREAVAVRLQTQAPVVAELSGGLDSSSVVCMANHLIRSKAVSASHLNSLSFTWRNSLDEPFIREVESHCGIEGVHISTHDVPLITEQQVGNVLPEPFQPLRASMLTAVRRFGANTILTGQGGDLMMGNWFDDSLQVAAWLRRFRFDRAVEEALAWSKISRLPVYTVLWRAIQAALPPSATPSWVYEVDDGSYTPKSEETSFTSGFSKRTGVAEASSFISNDWLQAPPDRRKYFRALTTILELRQLQPTESIQHLDYTHPFMHRPLVEFLMTVPSDVLCRPNEPRRLMRSAFSDLLPQKVRERRSKALFNTPWQAALRPVAREMLKVRRLHVVERGYVEQRSIRSRLERLSVGLDCNETQLRQLMLVELWLRNHDENGVAEQVQRAA